MKSLILSLLLSTSAFAANICEFQDTHTFTDKVEAGEAKLLARTETQNFTALERQMIFATMKTYGKDFRTYENEYKAIFDFLDQYEECSPNELIPGPNAGEILYYEVAGKKIALVHFWPGDNEYGSIFEISKTGKFTHLAKVNDGEVYCK